MSLLLQPQLSYDTAVGQLVVRDPQTGARAVVGGVSSTVFPFVGRLGNQDDPTHRYTQVVKSVAPYGRTPGGAPGAGVLNVSLIDGGSGTLSDPNGAGIPLTVNVEKAGYLTSSAQHGEIDGDNTWVRQDMGDCSGKLVNVSIIQRGPGMGTATAWESHTTSVDPVANVTVHDVGVQLGALENTGTSGGIAGFFAYKWKGAGGTGLLVDSIAGATFEYGAQIKSQGALQFAIRTADGALLHAAADGSNQLAFVNDGTVENVVVNGVLAAQIGAGFFGVQGTFVTISHAPASSSSPGMTGQQTWDANYLYVCVATNTWKRVALGSW